jgi:hypothetical protein
MQTVSSVFSYGSDFRSVEFPTFRKFFVSVHDHFIPHARNNYHPHILSHRMLVLLSILLMTVKIAGISMVVVSPATITEASAITSSTVVSLANDARVAGGLSELKQNSLLASAAQSKANDMLARQYFAHNTPTGETPWTFIKASGYSYVTAGENLAIDFTEAESVQTAWMNSPGHKANIMNKAFQEIGIGIAKGMYNGHETTIVVQMFGTPIAQKVELPSTPTVVAKPTPAATPAATPAPVVAQAPAATPVPTPAQTPTPIVPIEIKDAQTSLQGDQLYVSVEAGGDVTKLLASYGTGTIMLDPAENNQWFGYIPLSSLNSDTNLTVHAYDISGKLISQPVGQFSESLNLNSTLGAVEGASITIFGKTLNPQIWQEKIFLIIIASLLACLILAIAIRRHVQHLSLIANTSFVVMLAAFMLLI